MTAVSAEQFRCIQSAKHMLDVRGVIRRREDEFAHGNEDTEIFVRLKAN